MRSSHLKLFGVFFALAFCGAVFGAEVRPEIQRLETFLEEKLQARYKTLFGDHLRATISITVNRKKNPSGAIDLGYLTSPMSTEVPDQIIDVDSI